MTLHTEAEAKAKLCPIARVSGAKEALRRVMLDPNAYTYTTEKDRGWCGLGGKPE
jgi:hypothetical protein